MKRQALAVAIVLTIAFAGKVLADSLSGYFSAGGTINIVTTTPLSFTNPSEPAGVVQASISSQHANVPAATTNVTLSAPSTIIDIWTSTDAAPLHVHWAGSPATTSDAAIAPGGAYRLNARGKTITTFSVIGDAATGTFDVVAN